LSSREPRQSRPSDPVIARIDWARVDRTSQPPPGYVLQSGDTSYVAERAQFDHWAALDEAAKARAVRRLVARAALLQRRGLHQCYPLADEREIELRAAALRVGTDVVRRWTGFDADRS
jgi:hypothetical protein